MNYGFTPENLPSDSLPLGAVGASAPDLVPDGNGEPYLPKFEPQNLWTETYACTVFSLLSHLEGQRKLLGLPERNWSDRFAAFYAKITNGSGTTFTNAYLAVLENWSPTEDVWPMPTPPYTFADYYSEPSDAAKTGAEKEKEAHALGMRVWVPLTVEGFREALKKVGSLWCHSTEHAFTVYRVDDKVRIFDTYPYNGNTGKRDLYLSDIGTNALLGAYYVPLSIKQNTMQFKEKTLYQLMEGIGGFLHFRNGVLVRDTEAKLMAEWTNLNSVKEGDEWFFRGGRTGKLTLKDIEGVQLYNTKGEKVSLGNPV